MFHGVPIGDGVYKVEVQGVMLPKTSLMFPNSKDNPPKLLFKDVKGQFTHWGGGGGGGVEKILQKILVMLS
jgi:hypothetical protein